MSLLIEKKVTCPHNPPDQSVVCILLLIFTVQTFMEVKPACELRDRYPIECHLKDRKHNRGQQQRK